jgi:hypothetical protein
MLEDLATSLYTFTTAQYARDATFAPDDRAALDEALRQAESASARLRAEQAWPKPQIRRWTTRSANVGSAS